ncbi:hypothetical protein [Streptomyces sp. NPDC005408]|uniref:hypothetical protein n=1 Tax=Streptomyces sp. NPDC005408 TaxID=3155341 RepID=UPI00339E8ABD
MGADLSKRLVPNELSELAAPLLPSFTARPQGGGTAPCDDELEVPRCREMPELHWAFGYPFTVGLMALVV